MVYRFKSYPGFSRSYSKPLQSEIILLCIKPITKLRYKLLYQLRRLYKYPRDINKVVGSYKVKVRVTNPNEWRKIDYRFLTESDFIVNIMDSLESDSVYFDIGASIGTHSIPVAMKLKKGKVYSFEPDQESAEAIRMNSIKNNLDNLIVVEKALSDKSDLKLTLATNGLKSISPILTKEVKDSRIKPSDSITVKTISLSTFCTRYKIENIGALKIDVEGYEEKVLDGFGIIRPKHIFIEIHPRLGVSKKKISNTLKWMDYYLNDSNNRDPEILDHWVHKAR